MVGQTQECERAWVGDFNYPTGHLILRHFPAKISNSILMIFLSSVVARWGPKSAQIEKCKVETLSVGPFHIGFKGKKWVLGVFHISPPCRSETLTHTNTHTHKHTHANTHISHTHSCRVLSFRRSGGTPHTLLPLSLLCIYLFLCFYLCMYAL